MALTTNYNPKTFLADYKLQEEVMFSTLVVEMIRVCQEFLVSTRSQVQDHAQNTYMDRTTDLRNSLGAYIYHNGVVIWADGGKFDLVNRGIIKEQVTLTPNGYNIIGIASKEYASCVESKGYNVMTNQGEDFLIDLGQVFTKAGNKMVGRLKIFTPTYVINKVSYG